MTKTTLRPGLDLNILVEIHVLGTQKESIDKYLRWLRDPARLTYSAVPPEEGYHQPRQVSQFVEVAMNLIVERMRNDWFSFKVWQSCKDPLEDGGPPVENAVVSFVCGAGPCPRHGNPHHDHHGAYDVEGETLSHAICLAALEALKVKLPE